MAKDPTRLTKIARTEELRREIEQSTSGWRRPLTSKNFALAVLTWALFVAIVGAGAVWTRERPLVDAGRVARDTRTVRAEFTLEDEAATEQARSAARLSAPRVYVALTDVVDDVRRSLENLPAALQGVDSIDKAEPGLQKQFGLTGESLAALRQNLVAGQVSDRWTSKVHRLSDALLRTPILDSPTYQVERTSSNQLIDLRIGDDPAVEVAKGQALDAGSPGLVDELRTVAMRAGFTDPVIEVVIARLTQPAPRPTFHFDSPATQARQELAARAVKPKTILYTDREIIFRRGDVLTGTQLEVFRAALHHEQAALSSAQVWSGRAAVFGLVGAVALAMAGYVILFVTKIRRNPARMAAVAALLGAMALLAWYATVAEPRLAAMTLVAPSIFCAVLLCIAYDQRVALAMGSLHGILVCSVADQPVGVFAIIVIGIGVAVWRLREIRDRDTLMKLGVVLGAALLAGTFVESVFDLPLTRTALRQAGWDAGLAGAAGLLVAGVTLFILPLLEKTFGITTGMTLVELRDPKNPLLRQLQQRAPGTYNHSLNLASLGEAAAEAIGADGLLTYVGALYHDIGKMNKPDYFVENQTPGINRHDKLSPAMSLLVILGHVKDGMELAREFNLPRPLWHFIESHHGTTLVEYFYHRARRQAEAASLAAGSGAATGGADPVPAPTEIEYRYPGPRPRSREAAIIMLCDAVESAARAMADPTPSRIDALVHAIASKRLMDGQFDESEITLRDLNTIVEAVSKTLASIYHGRIAYPGGDDRNRERTTPNGTASVNERPSVASVPSRRDSVTAG